MKNTENFYCLCHLCPLPGYVIQLQGERSEVNIYQAFVNTYYTFQNLITVTSAFLVFGTVIYTPTLLSSSFVEEEHQTWYFFTVTVLVLTLTHCLYNYDHQCKVLQRQKEQERIRELNFNHVRLPY